MRHPVVALAACGASLLLTGPARGQLDVPADRQVLVLSRALSYDNELKRRVGSDILVAVLSKAGPRRLRGGGRHHAEGVQADRERQGAGPAL